MSSFTSPPIVIPLDDGRNWKLHRSFKYHVGSKYNKYVISVPEGFVTDFASVPFFLWWWLPYWGKYGKAAILHDYIYKTKQVSRTMADDIFHEAMLVGGTPTWKAWLMYEAVHIWGWLSWR